MTQRQAPSTTGALAHVAPSRARPRGVLHGSVSALLRLLANPLGAVGFVVLRRLVLVGDLRALLATQDPLAQDLNNALQPPSAAHWFGTDELGRDIYSRIVYGSRVTLYIVALVSVTVGPIGLAVGTTAGYLGGWVDTLLMRITDSSCPFPSLVLALAFVAALGPGLEHAVVAIALTAWPPIARLARAETLTIRRRDFIAAARLQGASTARIIAKASCRCACRR